MERFGGFESRPERIRTPEERFLDLARRQMEKIRRETQDPLAREIAEKILFKLDLKSRLAEVESHRDDPLVYQDLKHLGLFLVFDRTAQHEWRDGSSDFLLDRGDRYLDLHLPPIDLKERKLLLTKGRESLKLLARYIQEQKLNPKYIMGVTYEKLASVSRRFGFKLIEPPVSEEIRRGVENVYRDFVQSETGKKEAMGKILVCYQNLDEFMDRYSESGK